MPSYFTNAAPEVPRPGEETFLQVDPKVEAMFGAKRISQEALAAMSRKFPDVKIIETSDEKYEKDLSSYHFLVCKVYPESQMEVKEEKDAHGHKTISVEVPETVKPQREVLLVREMDGATFPVLLISEENFKKVYKKASGARMEKGKFLGLINAELLSGLLNPVFVVLLTPLVVAFFTWRVRRGKEVSTARKIFYGMVITTISLAVMALGAHLGGDGESKVSMMWLVVFYLIITLGELCLSPMGLSLVTKLAPKRLVGLMMGGWFLSTSIGNKLAGFISGLPATTVMFAVLGGAILLVAAFLFVLLPKLDRAIKKYGA
jgi:hypothetical protein